MINNNKNNKNNKKKEMKNNNNCSVCECDTFSHTQNKMCKQTHKKNVLGENWQEGENDHLDLWWNHSEIDIGQQR